MAKFSELSDQDKINHIKETFANILEEIAKDPAKIKNYVDVTPPKLIVPSLETIKADTSEEDKKALEQRNTDLIAKVAIENSKLEESFKKREGLVEKIKSVVSTVKKLEGCLCGSCININITNGTIPSELEVIIDAARKHAEEKSY